MMDDRLRELVRLRMQPSAETLPKARILSAEYAGHCNAKTD